MSKTFLKLYLLWFSAFAMGIVLLCCIFQQHEKHHGIDLFIERDRQALTQTATLLRETFDSAAQHLLLIRHVLETNPAYAADRGKTAIFFKEIADKTATYLQLRTLDLQGRETVKIIQDDAGIRTVPSPLLQDKQDRYYFQDSRTLGRDDIYYSPIDLNEENHHVETPLNPTFRFCTKLYDHNRHAAYLIANVSVKNRFSFITQQVAFLGDFLMANEGGYFLVGLHEDDGWGAQLPGRDDRTVQHLYPKLWQAWQEKDSGMVPSPEGWFFFQTFQPFHNSDIRAQGGDRRILMASFLSRSALLESIRNHVRRTIFGSLLAATVALFLTFLIVKSHITRQAALAGLRDQNDALVRLDQAKQSFFSMVTHDLRTPLTAMRGFLFLLIREGLGKISDTQRDALETVNRHCERMLQMVNDLLDAGKMAAGRFDIVRRTCELQDVVNRSLAGIASLAKQKNIRLESQFDNAGLTLPLDADRFQQALVNLISNSIKFSPENSCITIRQHRLDTECLLDVNADTPQFWEKPSIWLSVRDEGPGLQPEELAHIFDQYYQAEQSATQKKKGTGLGLGIARGIIESHQGMIWAESRGRGLGVTFNILLPLEPAGAAQDIPAQKP